MLAHNTGSNKLKMKRHFYLELTHGFGVLPKWPRFYQKLTLCTNNHTKGSSMGRPTTSGQCNNHIIFGRNLGFQKLKREI